MAIKHFNQGDLDGLCGIYAIVNAITHRIIQQRALAQLAADNLFRIALRAVPQEAFPDVLLDGIDHPNLLRVSQKMVRAFAKDSGIVIRATAPYRNAEVDTVTEFFDYVSERHSNEFTAFVFGISHYDRKSRRTGGHWVAFKEFAPHGIKVLNNGKSNFIRGTSLRLESGRQRIDYRETIMFKLLRIDGEDV